MAGFREQNTSALCRNFIYVGRLRTLLALDDLKFHVIAFRQALVAFAGDAGIMNKYIGPVVASDETVPLGIVKPLHFTFNSSHVLSFRSLRLEALGTALAQDDNARVIRATTQEKVAGARSTVQRCWEGLLINYPKI